MINSQHASVEIERAILGLLLVNKKAINNIRGFLLPEDFYDAKNSLLFQTILSVHDEGFEIELAPVVAKLRTTNSFDKIGGEQYLAQLINESGIHANITKYIKAIADKSQLRKVAKVIAGLGVEISKSDISAEALLEKVESDILSSTRETKQKDFENAKSIVDRALQEIEKKAAHEGVSGLASEFPTLDNMTSGFQRGDLVIVAARPSMGKTAFALNLAATIAKNHTVALFSLEMPAVQIMNRLLSFTGYVEGNKLREPNKLGSDDWTKLHLAKEKVAKLKLYVDDSAGVKLGELVWKAKKLHKNVGLDMIVIDYLQLLSVGNASSDNRQAEVSVISRTLKQLARELDVPVVALSQLSRRVEQRENKTPMMSDLRESGAIEQDADLITFLYREAYYKPAEASKTHQKTDIIISKHRNGAVGVISLQFNPMLGLFTDSDGGHN